MAAPTIRNALFVDTAGWAEPVLQNTPRHYEMDAYSQRVFASRRPLITTDDILSELVALLTSRATSMPRPDLIRFVNRIRAMPQVHIIHVDEATWADGWAILEHAFDKEWSLVDAMSFVIMRRLSISEVFTSDRHFAQAGFMMVP